MAEDGQERCYLQDEMGSPIRLMDEDGDQGNRAALWLHRVSGRQESRDLLCPGEGVQGGAGEVCGGRHHKGIYSGTVYVE